MNGCTGGWMGLIIAGGIVWWGIKNDLEFFEIVGILAGGGIVFGTLVSSGAWCHT